MDMFIRTFRNLYPLGMFEYFELHEAEGTTKGEPALFILKGYLLEHPRKAQPDWLFIAAFRQHAYFEMAFDLVQSALMHELLPTMEKLVEERAARHGEGTHLGGSVHDGVAGRKRCVDLRPIQEKDTETFAEPQAEEGRQGRVIDIGPTPRAELPTPPAVPAPATPTLPAAFPDRDRYRQLQGRGSLFDAVRGLADEMNQERRNIYGNQQQSLADQTISQPTLAQLLDAQLQTRSQLQSIQNALLADHSQPTEMLAIPQIDLQEIQRLTGLSVADTPPLPDPSDVAVIGRAYGDLLDAMAVPSPDVITTPDG